MKHHRINEYWLTMLSLLLLLGTSCSTEEVEMRTPDDILGIWSNSAASYREFSNDNTVHNLFITEQDGESIGIWNNEVYFYEPGYQLVIYIDYMMNASVYQIVELSSTEMTWCWVKDIRQEYESGESIGNIIGNIIKEAQEGFKLDPGLYEHFRRIPQDKFYELLENLDIMYPW